MKARDVMTSEVITATPETEVHEIAALMLRHRISGVPIVDAADKVVGIVSEGDLLHREETETLRRPRSWWLSLVTEPSQAARDYVKSHGRRAADVMTREVVTVTEGTALAEIAELLERHRIKRVPVVRDGVLVGIVSRANLLHGLAAAPQSVPGQTQASDAELREAVRKKLAGEPWSADLHNNVVVTEGVVHFWGSAGSEDERTASRIAAESVPGVTRVEDHRGIRPFPYDYGL